MLKNKLFKYSIFLPFLFYGLSATDIGFVAVDANGDGSGATDHFKVYDESVDGTVSIAITNWDGSNGDILRFYLGVNYGQAFMNSGTQVFQTNNNKSTAQRREGNSSAYGQGYYRDLLESILRHGFRVTSDDRNDQSNPFHRKFLRTIPDDIRGFTDDEDKPGRWDRIDYKGKAPFSRTKDLDYGDLVVETRSKYPMTYDTPWVAHQKVLDEGVDADRDIVVPTHVDREGNVVEPKRYFQSRLAGLGEEIGPFAGQETTTTKEGLVIPKNFKSQYFTPHLQSGGALGAGRGDGRWGKKLVTEPQPSAQALMNFGIDPVTRARQQVGVVNSGASTPSLDELQAI